MFYHQVGYKRSTSATSGEGTACHYITHEFIPSF